MRFLLLLAVMFIGSATTTIADDTAKPAEPGKMTALEAAVSNTLAAEQAAREHLLKLQESLQMAERDAFRFRRESAAAEKEIPAAEEQRKTQEQAARKANEANSAAEKGLADAEKAQADIAAKEDATDEQKQAAEKAVAEARKKLEEVAKANDTAQQAEKDAVEALAKLQNTHAESKAALTAAEAQAAKARQDIEAHQKAIAGTAAARLKAEEALQAALKADGRWVSFADEVAPIFHSRCVACHNARTARGRLNLDSYALLFKGGDSGESLVPGDSENSLLCIVIEDGSMPQDADPLTEEQAQTISRWVAAGARLDPGIDPNARLIEIMPKRPQPPAPEQYPTPIPVTAVAVSPDGKVVATSGYHEVLLWNAEDGSLLRRVGNVAERVYDIAFHPDGTRFAIASGTPGEIGEIKVFQVDDGTLLADLVKVEDAMFGVAFSPDGKQLAGCGSDRSIRFYQVEDWKELHVIEDHADWVMAVAWSPDGTRLVSASRDKTAKLFDATKGEAISTFNSHGDIVYGVTFLADGKQVASCGGDKQIRIWNVSDTKEARRIGGFGGDILQITALPDGRLVTSCVDRLARVHQSSDGKELFKLTGHKDWVYTVDSHAEGNRAISGSYDGEIRVWNLADGKPLHQWIARPTPAAADSSVSAPQAP